MLFDPYCSFYIFEFLILRLIWLKMKKAVFLKVFVQLCTGYQKRPVCQNVFHGAGTGSFGKQV